MSVPPSPSPPSLPSRSSTPPTLPPTLTSPAVPASLTSPISHNVPTLLSLALLSTTTETLPVSFTIDTVRNEGVAPSIVIDITTVSLRDFVGQNSGTELPGFLIRTNTVDDLLQQLWNVAKDHLVREVKVETDTNKTTYSYSDVITPTIKDLEKFIMFRSVAGKRVIQLNNLSESRLLHFDKKQFVLYVHKYSNAINSRKTFDAVKRALLNPVLPGQTETEDNALLHSTVEKLKDKHGSVYRAAEKHWKSWATDILSNSDETHEYLIQSPPPAALMKFFTLIQESPAVHQSYSPAATITGTFGENERSLSLLNNLRKAVNELEHNVDAALSIWSQLDQHIKSQEPLQSTRRPRKRPCV